MKTLLNQLNPRTILLFDVHLMSMNVVKYPGTGNQATDDKEGEQIESEFHCKTCGSLEYLCK